MTSKSNWILAVGLSLALAACSTEPEPTADPVAEEAVTEDAMVTDYQPELDLNEGVEAARTNLAERLDLAAADIVVIEARRVVWSDGAMGCPEPDMMYTQALVEGYYIVVEANGERFAYHAGRDGRPFHCPTERSQEPPASPSLY